VILTKMDVDSFFRQSTSPNIYYSLL